VRAYELHDDVTCRSRQCHWCCKRSLYLTSQQHNYNRRFVKWTRRNYSKI